ncbi:MAG TPA: phospholipid carrier-dependent glycosyltransferase [Firmicutes bacterium]|jgi:4-amino-4-deoxy-L-arabinose transferase-like glycosyltransferase|nr:phospholipid carrier-dependent glycosyltransferase [Bacillota bacterium]
MKNYPKILFLLLLVSFYLFFAFNSYLCITDTVESNYALTAKEMTLSSNWLSPQIYGKYWYDKPIFFYWQTAAAFKLFGFSEFAARFFPALMGILSILLMFWFSKKLSPANSMGLISGLILATCFEFWGIAKMVITDMTLFFFFNGALACFFLAYRGEAKQKNYYYLFYLFCGFATLTKGPIGFLLPGLIILLFLGWSKNWSELKNMRLLPGIILFLVTAIPWYYMMYLKHGRDFLMNFFGVHNYLRATVAEHPRDNVFYYYFTILLLGFFPWIAFLPQTIKNWWSTTKTWKNPDPETKFLILWIAIVFLFFQLIATKYITYTFPILFPLALLTAKFWVTNQKAATQGSASAASLCWSLVYITLFSLCLLGVVQFTSHHIDYPLGNLLLLLSVIILGYGCCFYLIYKGDTQRLFIMLLATTLLFNGLVTKNILLPLSQFKSAKELAFAIKDAYRPGDLLISYGEYPTSAVFYSGKKIFDLTNQDRTTNSGSPKLSWASKRVMPTITMADIENQRNSNVRVLVVLLKGSYPEFLHSYPIYHWRIIKKTSQDYLLAKIQ